MFEEGRHPVDAKDERSQVAKCAHTLCAQHSLRLVHQSFST